MKDLLSAIFITRSLHLAKYLSGVARVSVIDSLHYFDKISDVWHTNGSTQYDLYLRNEYKQGTQLAIRELGTIP